MGLYEQVIESRDAIWKLSPLRPEIALVLGSGLQFLEAKVEEATEIPYSQIPHFRMSGVSGHSGKLRIGKWNNVPVMLFCGRIHLYEGFTPQEVCHGVRTAVACGAKVVMLTNAAGGLSPSVKPGSIVMLKDHINLQATNVLMGPEEPRFGARFQDMTDAYACDLRAAVKTWAKQSRFPLKEGVYTGLLGPSYETKAEIKMLRTLGTDTVGMSTVQEAIAARQFGAKVMGFSIVTNLAAGISAGPLSHAEVKETALAAQGSVETLFTGILPVLQSML